MVQQTIMVSEKIKFIIQIANTRYLKKKNQLRFSKKKRSNNGSLAKGLVQIPEEIGAGEVYYYYYSTAISWI